MIMLVYILRLPRGPEDIRQEYIQRSTPSNGVSMLESIKKMKVMNRKDCRIFVINCEEKEATLHLRSKS